MAARTWLLLGALPLAVVTPSIYGPTFQGATLKSVHHIPSEF
jgi:hypothetical protein